MKSITELTERDCIHCSTQAEWDGVLAMMNIRPHKYDPLYPYMTFDGRGLSEIHVDMFYYTIHPASDFLPAKPTVSVLHTVKDYSLIRNGSEVIIIKGSQAMTLTGDVINWIKTN